MLGTFNAASRHNETLCIGKTARLRSHSFLAVHALAPVGCAGLSVRSGTSFLEREHLCMLNMSLFDAAATIDDIETPITTPELIAGPGTASPMASVTHQDRAASQQQTKPSDGRMVTGSLLGKRTAEVAQLKVRIC